MQTVWWQIPSYLRDCDAIVEHFKAVFELSWDGQAHADGEFFQTEIADLFNEKEEVTPSSSSAGGLNIFDLTEYSQKQFKKLASIVYCDREPNISA